MMQINCKKLDFQEVDLSEFILLDKEFMQYPWTNQSWENIKHSKLDYELFGAYLGEYICGFVLFQKYQQDATSHLLKIVINPNYRKQGYAKKILKRIFSDYCASGIENIYLEVATKNTAAISLYQSLNFKVLVEKKRYYSNGENAYAMQLNF